MQACDNCYYLVTVPVHSPNGDGYGSDFSYCDRDSNECPDQEGEQE